MIDSHENNHAAGQSGRHLNGVRAKDFQEASSRLDTPTDRKPVLGITVFDTRDLMNLEPACGLMFKNSDDGCKYPVSYRQLMLLVRIQHFLEGQEQYHGSDYRSYLLGCLEGLVLGDPHQLVGYECREVSPEHAPAATHEDRLSEYPEPVKSTSSESSFVDVLDNATMDDGGRHGNVPPITASNEKSIGQSLLEQNTQATCKLHEAIANMEKTLAFTLRQFSKLQSMKA